VATRTVTISDFSGEDIPQGQEAKLNLLEYPDLSSAVVLDVSQDEIDKLKLQAKKFALIQVGDERIAIDASELDRHVKGDIYEILAHAQPLDEPRQTFTDAPTRQRRARGTAAASDKVKIDYTSVEHAGSVKRGIVSDGEKQTVREHFDEVNENLAASGQRTLNLHDIAIVERYGLKELAKERNIEPKAM
jgi:hypothetical protein